MDYIEEYKFTTSIYGIEDSVKSVHPFQSPQDKRYRCWKGGCRICVGHDTIEEARKHIRAHVCETLTEEITELTIRLEAYQEVVNDLKNDPMKKYQLEHRISVNFSSGTAGDCICGAKGYVCKKCKKAMCEKLAPSTNHPTYGTICPECACTS